MGQSYRDLQAWRKSISLVKEIYSTTKSFPADERFGLISQLRRAAVSVPSNIAEGQARYSQREFMKFLSHARGSLAEVETQLTINAELGYLSVQQQQQLESSCSELNRILNGLYASIELRSKD